FGNDDDGSCTHEVIPAGEKLKAPTWVGSSPFMIYERWGRTRSSAKKSTTADRLAPRHRRGREGRKTQSVVPLSNPHRIESTIATQEPSAHADFGRMHLWQSFPRQG